jgi:hypothetical protein
MPELLFIERTPHPFLSRSASGPPLLEKGGEVSRQPTISTLRSEWTSEAVPLDVSMSQPHIITTSERMRSERYELSTMSPVGLSSSGQSGYSNAHNRNTRASTALGAFSLLQDPSHMGGGAPIVQNVAAVETSQPPVITGTPSSKTSEISSAQMTAESNRAASSAASRSVGRAESANAWPGLNFSLANETISPGPSLIPSSRPMSFDVPPPVYSERPPSTYR